MTEGHQKRPVKGRERCLATKQKKKSLAAWPIYAKGALILDATVANYPYLKSKVALGVYVTTSARERGLC